MMSVPQISLGLKVASNVRLNIYLAFLLKGVLGFRSLVVGVLFLPVSIMDD